MSGNCARVPCGQRHAPRFLRDHGDDFRAEGLDGVEGSNRAKSRYGPGPFPTCRNVKKAMEARP